MEIYLIKKKKKKKRQMVLFIVSVPACGWLCECLLDVTLKADKAAG